METLIKTENLYSFEEYLEMEEKSLEKYEFHNGKRIPMAGGTLNHNTISGNLIRIIGNGLIELEKPCATLTSDQKIFMPTLNKSVYPDVTVYCGEPEFYLKSTAAITNPLLIVEVLSDTTAGYDRTTKFQNYCSLPSFREYVLVSQNHAYVEAFYLHDPETELWKITRASDLDSTIELRSIGCTLALKDIYRMVKDLQPMTEPDESRRE